MNLTEYSSRNVQGRLFQKYRISYHKGPSEKYGLVLWLKKLFKPHLLINNVSKISLKCCFWKICVRPYRKIFHIFFLPSFSFYNHTFNTPAFRIKRYMASIKKFMDIGLALKISFVQKKLMEISFNMLVGWDFFRPDKKEKSWIP